MIRLLFAVLALIHLAIGLFMLADPGTFYNETATFPPRNDHFTRDLATYSLAFSALLAGAVRWPAWRVPAVVFGLVQYAIHLVNHIFDAGQAEPESLGVTIVFVLAAGLLVLAALALMLRRERAT